MIAIELKTLSSLDGQRAEWAAALQRGAASRGRQWSVRLRWFEART